MSCADSRLQREKTDYEQHLLIRDIFLKKNRRAGWRVIRMNLERQSIIMNLKKIRRLMKKYDLITQIRRRNPYKTFGTDITDKKLSGVLIHSDQGFHYTHPFYIKHLADRGIVQSMSRKGNCLDNAPVESFFGHMTDEINLTCCYSLDQVRAVVDEYIYQYNHHRYQWERKKMAPVAYRNHLLAG